MDNSGQGDNNPPGEEQPQDQSKPAWEQNSSWLYEDPQRAAQDHDAGAYHPQHHTYQPSTYGAAQAPLYSGYTVTQPLWHQPGSIQGSHEGYGYGQAGSSYGATFQPSPTPATQYSGHGHQSTPQYGQQEHQTTPDTFFPGSVRPGTNSAPRQNWSAEDYFGGTADIDEEDEMRGVKPNYSAPIDMDNLPAVASVEQEEIQAETERRVNAERDSIEEKAQARTAKAIQKAHPNWSKYREQRTWEEAYIKEKVRIVSKINEIVKEEYDSVKKERDSLLAELKKHETGKCKCDNIHQYLWFTGENRATRREEAYQRGWLTRDELASLECRSRTHSPAGSAETDAAAARPGTAGDDGTAKAQGKKKDDRAKGSSSKKGKGSGGKRGKNR